MGRKPRELPEARTGGDTKKLVAVLRWQLEHGRNLLLYKQLEKEGKPPKSWTERPTLADENRRFWNAFNSLSETRGYDMAGNPLPVSFQEMDAFFRVYGIRRLEDRMPYVAAIQAMDAALINHMRKAPAPAPKSPSRPPDPRAPAAQAAAQVRSSAPVSWPTINPTAGEIPVTSSGRRPTEDNPSSPAWPF